MKIPVKVILRQGIAMIGVGSLNSVFLANNALNAMFSHQPGYPWPGNWNALLLQLHCNSRTAIPAIALLIHLFN
jgi:hypothetical protein